MKKETLLVIVVTLVVGVLIGVLVTKGGKQTPSAPPVASPPAVNYQQNISVLEGVVAKDPSNRNAWIQLGNNYFDSDQFLKAIEAYDKALALDPDDPDVLTDQGVMYRRLGWYDKAAENFKKASDIDPEHKQSLYNLGVVYRYDMQDFEKAKKAWTKFLERNPTGPAADQVRNELEFIESHPDLPAAK